MGGTRRKKGELEILRLIDEGRFVDVQKRLSGPPTFRILRPRKPSENPLWRAVRSRGVGMLDLLLAGAPWPTWMISQANELAVQEGHCGMARLLFAAGADPRKIKGEWVCDAGGEMIEVCVPAGVDVGTGAALYSALATCAWPMLRAFSRLHVNYPALPQAGAAALCHAVASGSVESVSKLVAAGADPWMIPTGGDFSGLSAAILACENPSEALYRALGLKLSKPQALVLLEIAAANPANRVIFDESVQLAEVSDLNCGADGGCPVLQLRLTAPRFKPDSDPRSSHTPELMELWDRNSEHIALSLLVRGARFAPTPAMLDNLAAAMEGRPPEFLERAARLLANSEYPADEGAGIVMRRLWQETFMEIGTAQPYLGLSVEDKRRRRGNSSR